MSRLRSHRPSSDQERPCLPHCLPGLSGVSSPFSSQSCRPLPAAIPLHCIGPRTATPLSRRAPRPILPSIRPAAAPLHFPNLATHADFSPPPLMSLDLASLLPPTSRLLCHASPQRTRHPSKNRARAPLRSSAPRRLLSCTARLTLVLPVLRAPRLALLVAVAFRLARHQPEPHVPNTHATNTIRSGNTGIKLLPTCCRRPTRARTNAPAQVASAPKIGPPLRPRTPRTRQVISAKIAPQLCSCCCISPPPCRENAHCAMWPPPADRVPSGMGTFSVFQ